MKHLMIDMETLSVNTTNPVILTVAAIKFDPFRDDRNKETRAVEIWYERPDVDQQIEEGRHVDENTVAWWGRQNPEALEEAMGTTGRKDFVTCLKELSRWCNDIEGVWSNGSIFDVVILENAMREYNVHIPWKYWQVRDTRTLWALVDDPEMPKDGAHNAKCDAMRQVLGVQNSLRKLGVDRFPQRTST